MELGFVMVCPMNQESVVHSRGGTFAEQRSEIPGLRSENPSAGVETSGARLVWSFLDYLDMLFVDDP